MSRNSSTNKINIPEISLPASSGTIRGADENFHADAFTGASSFNIPIPIPSSRGLTPSIYVAYSSTSGNGLLGMGFHLNEDAISVKSSNALPLYNEKDKYIRGSSELVLKNNTTDIYLERRQSSFELIRKMGNSWKVTHNDNALSIYGEDEDAIISDPNDPTKIFKWLISSYSDSHGNKVKYNYSKFEGVNSYLTSVEYGNYLLDGSEYFAYKILIDYGQVDYKNADNFIYNGQLKNPPVRPDVLVNCRAGFIIKTEYRLQNIFIQHNFVNDPDTGRDCFTHRTEFLYKNKKSEAEGNSILKSVIQYSLKKIVQDEYAYKALPAIDLDFSTFQRNEKMSFTPIKDDRGAVINQPLNLVDYQQEGIMGILYRNAESLYYYSPLGNGIFEINTTAITAPNQFTDPAKPLNLVSLEGNGRLQIEHNDQQLSGYYPSDEALDNTSWLPFVPFSKEFLNNIPYRTEHIDLSGNNKSDELIITPQKIYYRASLGLEGYSSDVVEIDNINNVEAENMDSLNPFIYYGFANVYGDGMAHRIKLEDQRLTVWPNLGYGNFGAKQEIILPDFKIEVAQINLQKRLIVTDISGSGVADLVLIYKDKIQVFFNYNGKEFSKPVDFNFEGLTWSDFDHIQFVDVTGNGNTCLVFSKLSPHVFENRNYDVAHYYYEFNNQDIGLHCNKAFLLNCISNGMGVTTHLYYKSSVIDYLALKDTENRWLSKLPFPIIVLDNNTVTDFISNTVYKTQYTYRNGYYDTFENSFVGFGYVEHIGIPSIRIITGDVIVDLSLPEVLTKQWFHLGRGNNEGKIKEQFFKGDALAPDVPFQYKKSNNKLSSEALLALIGSELHHEVYDNKYPDCPYSLASSSYEVIEVQAPETDKNKRGVYRVFKKEEIDFNYEKKKDDPRVSHSFVLETDEYNHPVQTCSVVYPRRSPLIPQQGELHCLANISQIKSQDNKVLSRIIGIKTESKSFEVTGLRKPKTTYYRFDELYNQLVDKNGLIHQINYSDVIDTGKVQCRLLSWEKEFYWKDGTQTSLLEFFHDSLPATLLPHHSESIVFDITNVKDILGNKSEDIDFALNGYEYKEGYWWMKSAVSHFEGASQFYLPKQESFDWVGKDNYLYTEKQIQYDIYSMFPVLSSSRLNDAIYIGTAAEIDYRLLSPWRVKDINGNKTEVITDILGMVVATAKYEKDGINGDEPLEGFKLKEVIDLNDVLVTNPLGYIQQAASFSYYEFPKVNAGIWTPAYNFTLERTVYKTKNKNDIQRIITYSDGFGRVIESKAYAGKQSINNILTENAWIASDRVVYNKKGEVTKSYLSYFSDTFAHQNDWEENIKGTLPPPVTFIYDAAGRQIQTNSPKGFFTKIAIPNAWEILHYDESDTVLESDYYQRCKRGNLVLSDEEKDALLKSVLYYNTPSVEVMDCLGRQIMTVSDNRMNKAGENATHINWNKDRLTFADIDSTDENLLIQWQSFDIQGRVLLQADARFNDFNQKASDADKKYNFKHVYPIAFGIGYSWSCDAGESWSITDASGNILLSWDSQGTKYCTTYDNLHRPILKTIQGVQDTNPRTIFKTVYGEIQKDAHKRNLVGKVFQTYDSAGLKSLKGYTFDGYPVYSQFQFRKEYKKEADWNSGNELLEDELFTIEVVYDAAGRLLQQTLPDGSVCRWKYAVMGNCILSSVIINGETTEQNIVTDSQLNQFGQLTSMAMGNGVHTRQTYDPLTMQLKQIRSNIGNKTLQSQLYWHDPTGLITTMSNTLDDIVFNGNQAVSPVNNYSYDAIYRLLSASGRVQLSKGNLQDIEKYIEKYSYDKGNNLLSLQRICSNAFTRKFAISDYNNRVNIYSSGKSDVKVEYDAFGQMQNSSGFGSQKLAWNAEGNIASVTIVDRGDSTMNPNDAEYNVYSGGIRVRKVTERLNSGGGISVIDKRYLGGYKRTVQSNADIRHSITIGGVTKHDCVAQYSTNTNNKISSEGVMYRFQHANHLNSTGLEINQQGGIISYEEYSPFGETVYNYSLNNLDSTKEYRYSAQERDDSTGLYYYGYRYYAPWLCRWTRPDPAGTIDGFNLYAFVGNEPIGKIDVMGLGKKRITFKSIIKRYQDRKDGHKIFIKEIKKVFGDKKGGDLETSVQSMTVKGKTFRRQITQQTLTYERLKKKSDGGKRYYNTALTTNNGPHIFSHVMKSNIIEKFTKIINKKILADQEKEINTFFSKYILSDDKLKKNKFELKPDALDALVNNYATVRAKFYNSKDMAEKIVLGKFLMELHPFTSSLLYREMAHSEKKAKIAGGGENAASLSTANWLATHVDLQRGDVRVTDEAKFIKYATILIGDFKQYVNTGVNVATSISTIQNMMK